jgi:hypothetical protein
MNSHDAWATTIRIAGVTTLREVEYELANSMHCLTGSLKRRYDDLIQSY